jgi:hypothetical protein
LLLITSKRRISLQKKGDENSKIILTGWFSNSMIFLAPIETVTPQQGLALKESDGARSMSE